MSRFIAFILLSVCFLTRAAFADAPLDRVQALQQQWAVVNYELKGKAQKNAFDNLLRETAAARKAFPESADIMIWEGIIKSTYAGVKGGLGALGLAKESRAVLEKAIELDGNALAGSAYTSLGTLYAKVPGWPVGFGDAEKARQLLEQGLRINPDGIDSNYFYGCFLMDRGDWSAAEHYLTNARNAAPRAGREVADKGRQQEITVALAQVQNKLAH